MSRLPVRIIQNFATEIAWLIWTLGWAVLVILVTDSAGWSEGDAIPILSVFAWIVSFFWGVVGGLERHDNWGYSWSKVVNGGRRKYFARESNGKVEICAKGGGDSTHVYKSFDPLDAEDAMDYMSSLRDRHRIDPKQRKQAKTLARTLNK